ncbi:hypothetical protein VPH35_110834 [Triticum aestivum]|uniref:Chromo domain-containing protein n=1 Tax=Triticum turgidum subsp. durum TaxID=4567 RepID=A0A9R0YM96_TRITD|nr:unnamed protein product [Triticum turgidum subsp. durum]
MKRQADKHRTDHEFAVGDHVFLKLQPYLKASVAPRANHKLAFKFYGPFHILERVGAVAYKLELPASSKVHPVFHVSLLKKVLTPDCEVLPQLPTPENQFQCPEQIMQQRVVRRGSDSVIQVLVKWSGLPEDMATWEDKVTLQQNFPRAPAWGQAASKGGGIVSDQGVRQVEVQSNARPKRQPRVPARLARPEWA